MGKPTEVGLFFMLRDKCIFSSNDKIIRIKPTV